MEKKAANENKALSRIFFDRFLATQQTIRLLKRDPEKYWKRIVGLYATGILYFLSEKKFSNVGRLAKQTYLIFRYIDDILDGDIQVTGNPLAIINRIKSDIRQSRPNPHPIAVMARRSLTDLEKLAKTDENPQDLFIQAIDAMIYDYKRREDRTTLTAQQLTEYYFNTFSHALNIMCIGFRSNLRITKENNLKDLALCQGHIYSIRDLEADWKIGIINIPKEVLDEAQLTANSTYKSVIQNPVIKRWIISEMNEYKERVISLQNELQKSGEKFTYRAIDLALLKHMLKAIEQMV